MELQLLLGALRMEVRPPKWRLTAEFKKTLIM